MWNWLRRRFTSKKLIDQQSGFQAMQRALKPTKERAEPPATRPPGQKPNK